MKLNQMIIVETQTREMERKTRDIGAKAQRKTRKIGAKAERKDLDAAETRQPMKRNAANEPTKQSENRAKHERNTKELY